MGRAGEELRGLRGDLHPQAPKAKYCSEECRRKHEQDRAREARRKGAKPKRDRVDRYLARSGAVHDEIMAIRREVAMRF